MAKDTRDSRIDNKVLQFDDLSRKQRKAAEGSAFGSTSNLATRADAYIASDKGKPKDRDAIAAARPYLKDKNVTVASASRNRVSMVQSAATSPDTRHEHEVLPGAGWYFDHHRDIKGVAAEHGFETSRAITASAVMSPQNSPSNEKAAVSALMAAHSGGKVYISAEVHDHLQKAEKPIAPQHRDSMVLASELHPETLAELSSVAIRDKVEHHGFDLKDVSRGGTKVNVAKAINVLRGNVSEDGAIDPHSSPKVRAYRDNIRDSVPDSSVHHEYMLRAADLGSKIRGENNVGQQMFDYHGQRDSEEGVLGGRRRTAEDTWMNSVSHGQKNMIVPGTSTNVMKAAGTTLGYTTSKTYEGESVHSDPRVQSRAVQHAANNAATIKSASDIGKKYGADGAVPSVLMQEVSWTEARRKGGKDPEFNKVTTANAKVAKPARSQQFTQLGLFGTDGL